MNIENLRGFVTIARTKSYTKAADRLFLSRPALSRQIAELEKELGVPLFTRTTRCVSLTPAGEACYEDAVNIVLKWDSLHDTAVRVVCAAGGTLKIGMYALRTSYYLSPIIEKFKSEFPQIEIEFVDGTSDLLRDALLKREVDILCMTAPGLYGNADVERMTISEEYPSVMLPASHPLAVRESIAPQELKNERFIMHTKTKSEYMYNALINIFRKAGVEPCVIDTEDNDGKGPMRILMGARDGLDRMRFRGAVFANARLIGGCAHGFHYGGGH